MDSHQNKNMNDLFWCPNHMRRYPLLTDIVAKAADYPCEREREERARARAREKGKSESAHETLAGSGSLESEPGVSHLT
jgi:hypothetical protein